MAESLPHPLSAVRAEHGWTYQQVAKIVAGRVGNMAAHRDKVYRWERHGVVPELEAQLALAAELTVPAQAVGELGWPSWLLVALGSDVQLPWTVANCLTVLERTAGAAMLDRRGFFTLSAGAVATVANDWLTAEPQRFTAALHGGRVDAELVAILERRAADLRHMLSAFSGHTVQAMADAELRTVTSLLTNAGYSEQVGLRLYALAAELGRRAVQLRRRLPSRRRALLPGSFACRAHRRRPPPGCTHPQAAEQPVRGARSTEGGTCSGQVRSRQRQTCTVAGDRPAQRAASAGTRSVGRGRRL
jgi:hypothetical protein